MNTAPQKLPRGAWMKRRVLMSLSAALVGWAAFMIYSLITVLIHVFSKPAVGTNPLVALLLVGGVSAVVVLIVWLVLLVPLVLIPDDSFLWKPGILTLIGVFTGPIIVCVGAIYQLKSNPTITIYDPSAYLIGGVVFPGLPSALIGGVTGMVAARFHERLLKKEGQT